MSRAIRKLNGASVKTIDTLGRYGVICASKLPPFSGSVIDGYGNYYETIIVEQNGHIDWLTHQVWTSAMTVEDRQKILTSRTHDHPEAVAAFFANVIPDIAINNPT